jgi:TonB family protein
MDHGVQTYFEERDRAARRVSGLSALFSAGLLGLLLLPTLSPPVDRLLRRTLDESVRFGYEGHDQYVRRIELRQFAGAQSRLEQIGDVQPMSSRRGGTPEEGRSRHPNAQPQPRSRARGEGTAEMDLTMRAVSRIANVPVVQSEDLVIEHLVRPDYPITLLDRNVEGRVMVQALVDTIGRVVDVQVMASSGEALFERAAEAAVWQCRFRPFRRAGEASEVYAVFRFSFRIYD